MLTILIVLFIITLIVILPFLLIKGLINPSKILKWKKNPTRFNVFWYWFLSSILNIILVMILIISSENSDMKKSESWKKYEAERDSISLINDSISLMQEKRISQYNDSIKKINDKQEFIKRQFSLWDGSHIKLTKYIKSTLNDPKSFTHIQTTYADFEDYIFVTTVFTAKNGFGGTLKNYVKAKIYNDGRIEIVETTY